MKKLALVFVLSVLVPSLVLAWLAVRSLRDQQFLLERQQSLLYQSVADRLAADVQTELSQAQPDFVSRVTAVLQDRSPAEAARSFDEQLRENWPLAKVGFVVSLSGDIFSPVASARPDARKFLADNGRFLSSHEIAEVYLNPKQELNAPALANNAQTPSSWQNDANLSSRYGVGNKAQQLRNVFPQQQAAVGQKFQVPEDSHQQQPSKFAVSEAEFRQLIGEESEGAMARFVDNKLVVLFWCRPGLALTKSAPSKQMPDGQLVFGAEIDLARFNDTLRRVVERLDAAFRQEICAAVLDDMARPVVLSQPGFYANWKHPFVATEIGETLPHWEVAAYLLNPARLTESARVVKMTLGLLIAVLVLAIGIGSWLIVSDLNRQLTLARQKTDFVSNVSHELKTPLTSIRMFSELLAEGRVTDPARQHSYLGIITAETARLTRLINNVLDFARIERGEKKYNFQRCDLVTVAHETAESYRPHLEANGFAFDCRFPSTPIWVNGDRDALAQVLVNLLSNAEKYSGDRKEISLEVEERDAPLPHAQIKVLDRGLGVPRGSEQKIFEKIYRAHDSLSSGIQGSGLGLTLARQIARAHGGDVAYERRDGGGSIFSLRLPVLARAEEA